MDKYSGKKLDGRYEIHELIGVGGMAYVYRCTDTIDDREVAVKILKDEFLNNEEFIRRFKNESKAIAMLSHPNIVKVYDVSFGDMIQYIVMEYIDGITLKEYIEQQGVLDWREALHLTTQILKALQHAHNKGVVHRDIKPHNIMLLQDGTIKVTDFGIARLTDKATKTMTEQAIGSVHYIAPEQARGSKTDGKSDIYSVGVMLYEMITGKLPFEADSAVSVALMQLQSTPVMPRDINPGIPLGLEQITMHAMQKNPAQRYATALDMLGDLERFRLNPSVRFDYKHFVDSDPTKYVKNIKKTKRPEPDTLEEDNDEAEDIKKKKEHKTSYYAVKTAIICTVSLVVIFMLIALLKGCSSSQATDVEVPNFIGMNISEANSNNPNHFKFEIKSKFVKNKEMGEILAQDPEPGSKLVKSNSVIELTVNGTDTEVSVPYCKNTTKKEAVKALEDKNFTVDVIEVYDSLTPKGYVCDTFPPAGVKCTVGSVVYVIVSEDEYHEKIEVPKVTDLSLSEAQSTLGDALECRYTYDDDSLEPEGTVIGQSPLQYSKVEEGTIINLVVSSGKGSQTTVPITIDMPTNVDFNIKMTVSVDGKVDSAYSKTINPMYNTSYAMTFTGSGSSTIVVMLDGQIYRTFVIDYTTKNYTVKNGEYIPPQPETEPETVPETEPPTEPPTQMTMPPETGYYEPLDGEY
ncbi:MAG: Stk1 family PASTA domain-containing Ser/Thr kinase [Ruminococcus sp.]|nr:Stk1 family PASTA domain-containing Ser/Thr kinase [Ruminococcus sp.]